MPWLYKDLCANAEIWKDQPSPGTRLLCDPMTVEHTRPPVLLQVSLYHLFSFQRAGTARHLGDALRLLL